MNSRDFLGNNFNDFFALPQVGMFGSMRSDIYKSEEGYILEVDMPGFLKEEIKMDYNNGYLIVEALKNETREIKEYLRRERFLGQHKRSYYVGEIDESKLKATFENGILKVLIPKNDNDSFSKRTINIQ